MKFVFHIACRLVGIDVLIDLVRNTFRVLFNLLVFLLLLFLSLLSFWKIPPCLADTRGGRVASQRHRVEVQGRIFASENDGEW